MTKLVIFDWDGTLFDSIGRICTAMLRAGRQAGVAERTHADIQDIIGLSLDVAIHKVWPEESDLARQQVATLYKEFYVASDQTPPKPYPGVMEILSWLQQQGVQIAVATGKTRRGLDRVMALSQTQHFFAATRCADETISKPDPLMLKEILDELGVLPSEAIMVGDTEYDLEMAQRAGMRSVGLDYGAHSTERLWRHEPIAVLGNLMQLKELL
ncbi:HAD-IA family hydrolase [Maribrevibacterium harenarium]|uniref:HAD-IA family hydrolase n=1 Tax=Maribrevibacterium harenarium TaxID=2589817 RepID=A0A501X4Q5_9GAMM|nr:HAD-IA family hydrolase [Maribrevibacterium harenarium]TPE55502.1 HAD-IA family hydrolase [Maribrevibacterium harenarium]